MSRLFIAGLFLSLVTAACHNDQPTQEEAFLHKEDARLKPIVHVVPVIDRTNHRLAWNLSHELTSAIDDHLSYNRHLYLVDPIQSHSALPKINHTQNPFGIDISWIKTVFKNEEFVVFLELIEHEEVLRQNKKNPVDPKNCSADLNISMRVRVFDLRENEPKVVLQELVRDSHFIPRQFTCINFCQALWGEESFLISPIGLAHDGFTKEIAKRVEDYILLSAQKT